MTREERVAIGLGVGVVGALFGLMVFLNHRAEEGAVPIERTVATGPAPADLGERVATISEGERVEIGRHLIEGQRTVVEFTADW